jgi:hypothetical protein
MCCNFVELLFEGRITLRNYLRFFWWNQLGVLTFERSRVCIDLCLGFFPTDFCRSYLGTQTFFSVEFWKEGISSCPLHSGQSILAFGVRIVEIWLFSARSSILQLLAMGD